MNMKSQYATFECSICHKEDESQIHIYECKEILKKKNCLKERPKYEEIMAGDVRKMLPEHLKETLKYLDKLRQRHEKLNEDKKL